MQSFEFANPATVQEAVGLLAPAGDRPMYWPAVRTSSAS